MTNPTAVDDHQNLVSKTYLSKAVDVFSDHDLDQLLTNCRRNNAAASVTGALLYHNGYFMQLIEGQLDAINAIYDRIQADPRHEVLSVLFEDEISARFFPNWTMGYRAAEDMPLDSLNTIYETAKVSTTRFPINDFLLMFGESN
ncbi:MAG: BLUF domain-containing protein [Proteobacteria bacterium]|nr:BLUF domain-containing protein [Pseudomonadota bacterium]